MATAAAAAAAATSLQLSPAMNIMAPPVMAISMAVPRSGWSATSSTGTPMMAAGMISFHDRRASWAEAPWYQRARARTTPIFMSSEGWMRVTPRSSQLLALFTV